MPTVEKSAHLGILRSKSNQKTENSQIEQNITKARRTAYSQLDFMEKNGLDPITSISLYKTNVQPVLMYGLEIVQPKQTNLKKLEVFQKNILKQILSLPTNAPHPAIYIISGLLPQCSPFLLSDRWLFFVADFNSVFSFFHRCA